MKEPLFEKITQIALVVKSVDEKVKVFNDIYGMGPWDIFYFDSNNVKDLKVHGKNTSSRYKVALYKFGDITMELVEPLDKNNIHYEFLKEKGEGLHHICYQVKDYKKAVEFFKKRGMNITQDAWEFGESYYAYFDSEKELGHIAEIDNTADIPDFVPRPDGKYPPE